MGQTHIGHDCQIGDQVVLAQGALIGGHVVIDDYVTIGGGSCVYQHVKIGRFAMLGGASALTRDLAPYSLAAGNRCRVLGANKIGLERHGFSQEKQQAIIKALSLLSSSSLSQEQALAEMIKINDGHISEIIEFVSRSIRGFTRSATSM